MPDADIFKLARQIADYAATHPDQENGPFVTVGDIESATELADALANDFPGVRFRTYVLTGRQSRMSADIVHKTLRDLARLAEKWDALKPLFVVALHEDEAELCTAFLEHIYPNVKFQLRVLTQEQMKAALADGDRQAALERYFEESRDV